MNMSERCDRLDAMIEAGKVVRNKWTQGHDRACLLAALSPEVARNKHTSACPASVMPAWLAEDTVRMDDKGTLAAWPAMIRRYAAVARRWSVLTSDDWSAVEVVRDTAHKAYYEAVAPSSKEYAEALANAIKAYDEALANAIKAYDEALALARKAYAEAVALANDALTNAVLAAIEAACDKAEARNGGAK